MYWCRPSANKSRRWQEQGNLCRRRENNLQAGEIAILFSHRCPVHDLFTIFWQQRELDRPQSLSAPHVRLKKKWAFVPLHLLSHGSKRNEYCASDRWQRQAWRSVQCRNPIQVTGLGMVFVQYCLAKTKIHHTGKEKDHD